MYRPFIKYTDPSQNIPTLYKNILIFSYSIMEDTQEQDPVKIKRSTHNKERCEANKDYILKYRKIDNF